METNNDPVIRLENISKKFGGIYALNHVDFDLRNEIHSIVGHNGAGKTTLVKIIMGALQPDGGKIFFKDKNVMFASPREAQQNHIAMVWQELANFPNLTVTENLLMQRFIQYKSGGIDWKNSHNLSKQYLDRINLDINPKLKMGNLPLAQQQLVEFAKALSFDPSVLILDEPTSALSYAEQEILHEKVRMIKSQGVAILYISHKLDEVISLSDRITVLRDGKKVFTRPANELSKDIIVESIVGKASDIKTGKKQGKLYVEKRKPLAEAEAILQVKNLSMERRLHDVSFKLYKGEVLGITGVSGSGISEIGKILFGIENEYKGSILFEGTPYAGISPKDAVTKGMGYVPQNRKEEGIIPQMTVGDNIVISSLKEICRTGLVVKKRKQEIVDRIMDIIDLLPRNPEMTIESLSGGNQQKGVIARWISKKAKVLILDEPTRGVDVGAIQKIYSIIRKLADEGLSVIVITSEFEEVHSASDRMIVLNRGRVMGELYPEKDSWEEAFALSVK